MNAFLSELVTYLIKFVFLFAVAAGGVLLGKNLSKKKKVEQE